MTINLIWFMVSLHAVGLTSAHSSTGISRENCKATTDMSVSPLVTAEDLELEGTQLLQLHVPSVTVPDLNALSDTMSAASSAPGNATSMGAEPSHAATFQSFVKKHGRDYEPGSPDYDLRYTLFAKRAAEAAKHNSHPARLWTATVNRLSDHSSDELRALLGWSGPAAPSSAGEGGAPAFLQVSTVSSLHGWGHAHSLPAHVSWGHLNATRRVHNQGHCGSCWAVASVSVLQAHIEIHTPSRARSLSVQELVSCVENPRRCGGTGACDGATAELAMDYAMRNGLGSAADEAAEAVAPEKRLQRCPKAQILLEGETNSLADLSTPGVHTGSLSTLPDSRGLGIRAFERLPPNTYAPLMHALVERGPAAVAVFASKWFSYSHGIFDGCQPDAVIDHAVVLLGYGHDRKLDAKYWLVQNSWGDEWGEGGRIRLLRRASDETDYCGVDAQPKAGTGCDGGPEKVKVCGMCGILYDTVVPHF